ncbi:RES domain-containing protein [Isoptericola sp. NPDC055881]
MDLAAFPHKRIQAGRLWYRQHHLPPWYFSSNRKGRFDLDPPRGTCYLASRPEAAAREFIGADVADAGFVAAALLRDRYVSALTLPRDMRLAHTQHQDAISHGVISNELCHMTPYDVPQAWARAFDAAGFDGIWHTLRFSTTVPRGMALFGTAGGADWPVDPHPTPLRTVVDSMRISVLDTPSLAETTVVQPD